MGLEIDASALTTFISNPITQLFMWLFLFVIAIITIIFVIRFLTLRYHNVHKSFDKIVLHVKVPKDKGDDKNQGSLSNQQVQEKIAVAETLYSTIAGLKAETGLKTWFFGSNDVFSLELILDEEKINFYVSAPRELSHYIEEQINAQYPDAFIEEIVDYNIFSPKGYIGAATLKFGREDMFPIKTYKKFESDPMNAMLNALSKIEKGDAVAIQIVMRSAPKKWRNFGIKVASKMQQGKKFEDAVIDARGGLTWMFKGFLKSTSESKSDELYKLSPMEEETVKTIEEKASKAGVVANLRLVVRSEKESNVDHYLRNLINGFSQFNVYKYGNGFSTVKPKLNKIINDFIYRSINNKYSLVFNTEELASLFHLPIPFINETPNINWLEARRAPAPVNSPTEGLFLGNNVYRGKTTPIYMKDEDRVRHMYVIGMTGTGKTYYTSGLAMQDINEGRGVCFIDPHGSDIEDILARVPKERAEDVIFFDPTDMERPIGLNMLEYDNPEQKTFVVNEVMNIFDKLYDLRATGGPMFEQYFKNAAYLVMDDPESGSTLMEIPRVLADEDFRKMKLSRCKTQPVIDFWEKEAQKAGGEASLQNVVPYISSKLAPFIANDMMRPIISQQKSSINFRKAMDEGKIILVKLSKGKLGEINSHLLGMIIVGKIQMAALSRVDMLKEDRKPFYLYIDEFHNVLTDSIESILSEARKYQLSLTIAHQYIGQLIKNNDTKFKDAIFGNVGTKVAFRIGVEDAEYLTKEFSPVFTETDFMNAPRYNCFIKLLIDNANPPGFNMTTISHDDIAGLVKPNPELAKAIKELSRLKYGKDREIIEMEVNERIKKFG